MPRIDLDDLPPKIATALSGVATGEEVLLVQNGVVVGRLTGGAAEPQPAADAEPALAPEENAREIFEQFRSMMEDEF
jgi:antitoxin (DNA-binding transcriptional repressor) of toxin-antitoxin stability system